MESSVNATPILAVPSGLQDDLLKDLQETGMLQFAQNVGVLPDFKGERWQGDYSYLEESGGAQRAAHDPNSAMIVKPEQASSQQQQEQSNGLSEEPAQGMGSQPQGQVIPMQPGTSTQQVPDESMQQAALANKAADAAVEEAQAVLAAAHSGMHTLAGLGPSSSNASDGHAAELPALAAAAAAGSGGGIEEDEGTSNCRRRRSGLRADQNHPGLAAMAAAAVAAAAAGSGGLNGAGSSKPGKGLRHFSMKVCEKVESKGTTSYNEVADELVAEMRGDPNEDGVCYDEKNIRRRVYDAINVLMALDIIAKEKKAIMWKGFPQNRSSVTPVQRLLSDKASLAQSVERKAECLAELIEQQKALKHLLQRNSQLPPGGALGTALQLPFILVQAKPDATVEVQISEDMRDVAFDFYNSPFQIHDDSYVLRMMAVEGTGAQPTTGSGATEGLTGTSTGAAAQRGGVPAGATGGHAAGLLQAEGSGAQAFPR